MGPGPKEHTNRQKHPVMVSGTIGLLKDGPRCPMTRAYHSTTPHTLLVLSVWCDSTLAARSPNVICRGLPGDVSWLPPVEHHSSVFNGHMSSVMPLMTGNQEVMRFPERWHLHQYLKGSRGHDLSLLGPEVKQKFFHGMFLIAFKAAATIVFWLGGPMPLAQDWGRLRNVH